MKKILFITIFASLGIIFAHAQSIQVIDNSDFSVTPNSPVAIPYSVGQLAGDVANLKSRDATWTSRIAQDQATIATEQSLIDNAALNNVTGADPYASKSVQTQINYVANAQVAP